MATKRKRAPGKWIAFMALIAGAGIIATVGGWYYSQSTVRNTPSSSVHELDVDRVDSTPGGKGGSAKYIESVRAENRESAARAARTGESFVPVVVSTVAEPLMPEAPISLEESPVAEPARTWSPPEAGPSMTPHSSAAPAGPTPEDRRREQQARAMTAAMGTILAQWRSPSVQGVYVYVKPANGTGDQSTPRNNGATPVAATVGTIPSDLPIHPGEVLYAVNMLTVNSDVSSPVLAEIVGGALNGSRVLGTFKREEDRLVVRFAGLTTADGTQYTIDGYGIDPGSPPSASVASDVDHHYLQRWGGLAAASFLEGIGIALLRSGTTVTQGVGPGGIGVVTSTPEYSTSDQVKIAAGRVGQRFAGVLEQGFTRPPTVWLHAKQPIGILILSVQPPAAVAGESGQSRSNAS